mgnify:CR=1 FL=1
MNEFSEGTLSLPHIGSGTSDSTYWGIVHFAHCQRFLACQSICFPKSGRSYYTNLLSKCTKIPHLNLYKKTVIYITYLQTNRQML